MIHLKVFGSIVFIKTTGRLSKLEDRSKCMVFMGYEARSKAYRCLDPITCKIDISKDVIFAETKIFNLGEESKMRKISSSHSKTLHVTGLEELQIELTEEPREELLSNNLRERELSKSEESEEEVTLNSDLYNQFMMKLTLHVVNLVFSQQRNHLLIP